MYQLAFVICLVILGNLGNDNVVLMADDGSCWLEEDEGVRRGCSLCLLD